MRTVVCLCFSCSRFKDCIAGSACPVQWAELQAVMSHECGKHAHKYLLDEVILQGLLCNRVLSLYSWQCHSQRLGICCTENPQVAKEHHHGTQNSTGICGTIIEYITFPHSHLPGAGKCCPEHSCKLGTCHLHTCFLAGCSLHPDHHTVPSPQAPWSLLMESLGWKFWWYWLLVGSLGQG